MNDELIHYGVKGMKWGVRKDQVRGAAKRVVSRVKAHMRGSDDAAQARALYRKGAKQLSNAELQKAIYRMNLEQNYKRAKFERLPWARKVAQKFLEKRAKKLLEKRLEVVLEQGVGVDGEKLKATADRIRTTMKKARTDPLGFEADIMKWSNETAEAIKKAQQLG